MDINVLSQHFNTIKRHVSGDKVSLDEFCTACAGVFTILMKNYGEEFFDKAATAIKNESITYADYYSYLEELVLERLQQESA